MADESADKMEETQEKKKIPKSELTATAWK